MVKSGCSPKIVHDTSATFAGRSKSGASAGEWRNFMSPNVADMYRKPAPRESENQLIDEEMDIQKILKDIQYLGSEHMSWKERKELENQKVVTLGGKPPKKHRIPLNVATISMKKQKQREQKTLQEGLILGRFGKQASNHRVEKHKAEDRVLKASEGRFRKGVLNVKHLLGPASSSRGDGALSSKGNSRGHKKGNGKKKRNGKKKGKKRK
ncbi:axoneme-associated protein MST101(2) protein [Tasmannia lanceolata]|uniref:axoneme-associated protein MST101(2) protein n=1 Tax=Tasmannia lanceolata TaxID=3420 RepID=UPI004063F457